MKIMLNEARRNSSLKSIKECENKIEKLIIKIADMKEYAEIDFSISLKFPNLLTAAKTVFLR